MTDHDDEELVLVHLKPGEHRIYRSLDQGVMLLGVPFWWAMGMLFGGFLGFFAVKAVFGATGGGVWGLLVACAWGALFFVQAQDKTFIPMFVLKYMMGAKFCPHVTSYTRSHQRIVVTEV